MVSEKKIRNVEEGARVAWCTLVDLDPPREPSGCQDYIPLKIDKIKSIEV